MHMIQTMLSPLMISTITFGHANFKPHEQNDISGRLRDLIGQLMDYAPISAPLLMLCHAVSYSAEVAY